MKKNNKSYLRLLYLPIKVSKPNDKKWVEKMDNQVFSLVDQYSNIKLYVKPHPRTWREYQKISDYTTNYKRVKFYNRNTDSIFLFGNCDIIITPGTSLLVHALWLNIPVILIDDWVSDYNQSFMYSSFCYKLSDLSTLINNWESNSILPNKVKERDLELMFQNGIGCDEYRQSLNSVLNNYWAF